MSYASRDSNDRLNLYWKGLSYETDDGLRQKKTIINDLNGHISSGQLTGILGPSGAGKSTFIECLAGKRRTGLKGRVWVKHSVDKKVHIRLAYNAQFDALIDELTVEEALRYASQLTRKTHKRYDFFHTDPQHQQQQQYDEPNNNNNIVVVDDDDDDDKHREIVDHKLLDTTNKSEDNSQCTTKANDSYVDSMINAIGLTNCARVRAAQISGGQKKRLSIALELLFSPNILLLDEPTTGLDSRSSYQCLSLLKTLSYNREPLIIGLSIHQPTARLLAFFDNIYVLSVGGQCVYSGPTQTLIEHLSSFGLTCPIFHNPADYVVEVSSGAHGLATIDTLVHYEREHMLPVLAANSKQVAKHEIVVYSKRPDIGSQTDIQKPVGEQIRDLWCLTRRSTVVTNRHPIIFWLRIVGLGLSIMARKLTLIENTDADGGNGGQSDNLSAAADDSNTICTDSDTVFRLVRGMIGGTVTPQRAMNNIRHIGNVMSVVMFVYLVTIVPTMVTFPIELNTFVKERFNKWYTTWSYFMAKSIVDIPVVVVIPVIYVTVMWWITGEEWDPKRYLLTQLVVLLVSIASHSLGLLVSAFFINNIKASLISLLLLMVPQIMFSGNLLPISVMPYWIQQLTYLSLFRLAGEAMLVIVFGFDRCPGALEPITFSHLSHHLGMDMSVINDCMDWSHSTENVTANGLSAFNRFLLSTNPSKMLDFYGLNDNTLTISILLLLVHTIVLRILAYYVLKYR
ncbi:ATP-binding cassette subfamily G member 4-like, partial [Oppia nitens]|uniref:ATP-binding cassette subfamily G member 4-like n=1 Tax=Oppia nitens TaxID=1686743 RepID=UPI0023DB3CB5